MGENQSVFSKELFSKLFLLRGPRLSPSCLHLTQSQYPLPRNLAGKWSGLVDYPNPYLEHKTVNRSSTRSSAPPKYTAAHMKHSTRNAHAWTGSRHPARPLRTPQEIDDRKTKKRKLPCKRGLYRDMQSRILVRNGKPGRNSGPCSTAAEAEGLAEQPGRCCSLAWPAYEGRSLRSPHQMLRSASL